jgi:hypothetical protein
MRFPKSRFFRTPIFGVLLLCTLAARGEDEGKYVGAYYSHTDEAGKDGPSMNVSLGYDRTATVTEDPGTGRTITLFGRWAVNGGGVTITFHPQDGNPAEPPMNFTSGRDGLQATTWNHATWGKATPPPMKKGGAKVKDLYWFTSNR